VTKRLSRAGARQLIDLGLDRVRFGIDTFPSLNYQPLPWLGRPTAQRAEGFNSRWAEMSRIIDAEGPRTAVDIGCNVGAFSIALALRGIDVVGVENDPMYYRTAIYAGRKLQLDNFAVLTAELKPGRSHVLPNVDCAVFLSVWHHLVRWHGIDAASTMTSEIWSKTASIMFFETGERELPSYYGLPPLDPDPATWVAGYLSSVCSGAEIRPIGEHVAFAPDGVPCTRTLFCVKRID
jgi:hypothetical protein